MSKITLSVAKSIVALEENRRQIGVGFVKGDIPEATKAAPIQVTLTSAKGTEYKLNLGDTHSAWHSHQDENTMPSFSKLWDALAPRAGESVEMTVTSVESVKLPKKNKTKKAPKIGTDFDL